MNEAVGVFISAFCVAGLAGLAALLRSGKPLTWISVLTALLNSGLLGLGISLLWYTKFREDVHFLVGICLMAGLGGMNTVDWILAALKRGGFSVKIGKNGEAVMGEGNEKNSE
jgi:hypothetical protein